MNLITIKKVEYIFNMLAVLGISIVLMMGFIFQFFLHELPCPLCLLQRVGFTLIAMGFLFNLRFGLRPSHYAIVLLSAVYTGFVALRQVSLHVIPGTGNYGSAIFGLHMYTWSFIFSVLAIIVTTIMLGIDRQYEPAHINNTQYKKYVHALFALFFIITLANAISVWAECGWQECPDNPTGYIHSIS
jgi:disulfide bond formation protein DsbB